MKFKVELARLVRETRVVVVEAASEEDLNARLDEAYDKDDDLGKWKEDADWGCDEGTHTVFEEIADNDPALPTYHLIKLD